MTVKMAMMAGIAPLTMAAASASAALASPAYHLGASVRGPDGGWDLTSVDPAAHRLYVARSEGVMALDLRTGAVTPNLVPSQRGHAALVLPHGEVISTNGTSNTAVIFDGRTGKVRATVPTGKKPDAVAYDALTRTAWVMNADSGDATVIDVATAKVVATVAVGGSLELGVADGAGRLFVNVEDKNDVAVIDTRARKLVARFPLAGCDGPTGIAYAPEAKLLISACANGVAVVSARDGRKVGEVAIGPRPDGALYDAKRRVALIPSGGDGSLSVVRLSPKPVVVQKLATAKGARTAALDPVTGRVYLSAADYLPAVGTERPKMVPGSYRVIEVDPGK